MSLPPGFLDELRSRISLSQVVGRKVTWDPRKSNQGKGDLWAPCPFHQEKTASFHVDDRKGFYYCFGCHAKGDAIGFVKDTENVGFMEAVEILAREAGMPMPARDPQAQAKADRRTQLAEVMEQAVQFFRLQLKTGAASAARDYLQRRGLDADALARWEIGFAPDAWQGLWDHLSGKGVDGELILGCGLAKPSQKGGRPYDTFRGRIMFPIRDARGRCIAFGGRAMDPNDTAKYLNSPETELFDKGRQLYNHGPARTAAGKGQPVIVGEGYMDVIALAEHGFEAAVAPLGTAITEDQLRLLWRIAPEPIVALDGDKAGLRAAMRLIDLALPLLEAGQSLRFALMPAGKDPDDLLRAAGASAMQACLDRAVPMVDLLWRRETEGRNFDSPERKAALDKTLREKIALIKDPSIRQHYGQAIKDFRWELFRPKRTSRWRAPAPDGALSSTKASPLVGAEDGAVTDQMRHCVILATLVRWPALTSAFETDLEIMEISDPVYNTLRNLILKHADHGAEALQETIIEEMGAACLENLFALRHVAIMPCLKQSADLELARLTVAEELKKLRSLHGAESELEEALEDIAQIEDESLTRRLAQAAAEREQAFKGGSQDDTTEYDLGDNGARISKSERDAFASLMDSIRFSKPER